MATPGAIEKIMEVVEPEVFTLPPEPDDVDVLIPTSTDCSVTDVVKRPRDAKGHFIKRGNN